MKTFTVEQLAACNGQDGKPAYVAYQGIVYDISQSKLWAQGQHMRRHKAGCDLTTDIQAAPHQSDVLQRYPQVGRLEQMQASQRPIPGWLTWLLQANPFLRRHPHPMTVHFPIAFMLASPVCMILYLLTGHPPLETTAFHCLGGGVISLSVAIITGFFTWWYNYQAKATLATNIKIPASFFTLGLAFCLFIWRANSHQLLTAPEGPNMIYLGLSLGFIPLIGVIGWFGATLTFPLEKE